ncbi:MAG: ferritin [Acidithiobacillales bacterium]
MISKKMQGALEGHVGAEMESAYLYLAMSAWCESKAFKGFGRWLRIQFEEELAHATKLLDYLLSRGTTVSFGPVAAPAARFGSILEVFEKTLEHERLVTGKVHRLYELAGAEKDSATQVFLQWFVSEQVEEEARATEIVDKLRMVSERPGSALYLDKEYGKRSRA